MNVNCKRTRKSSGAVRPWAMVLIGTVGIAWLAVVITTILMPPAKGPQEVQTNVDATQDAPQVVQAIPGDPVNVSGPQSAQIRPLPSGVSAPRLFVPSSPSATLMLVESLARPASSNGSMDADQIAAWQQKLQSLIHLGSAALPAIHEFLKENIDLNFGAEGKQVLGYASARLAVLDALAQIGGADGLNMLSETMQSTTDPHELAFLAQKLDQLEPGQHQYAALDASLQTLKSAAEGNLKGKDVAPLFELVQKYGDLRSVSELEGFANKWNFYATLALAQLPEGAGVPSLLQMVTNPGDADSGVRMAAMKMLAQVATQSDQARTAMLDQARAGKFSAYDFAVMAPMLAGDQMIYQDSTSVSSLAGTNPNDLRKTYITSSNQSFFTAPLGAITADQVSQRNALIEDLLAITHDPAQQQALQQAQVLLSRRSTQIAGK